MVTKSYISDHFMTALYDATDKKHMISYKHRLMQCTRELYSSDPSQQSAHHKPQQSTTTSHSNMPENNRAKNYNERLHSRRCPGPQNSPFTRKSR